MTRIASFLSLLVVTTYAVAGDGNRLTYLDENNPYYVSKDFPKLTTPQWVGEEGVEAVVILAIDDMRDTARYEAYLRPILQRLKEIDGRAPVSIMTCSVKPDDPQLQTWLDEGLSIEVHTVDHPCPLLQGGDFARAKSTYDRCVDLLNLIPNNKPVAFRMPCCDSLNTVSPRFYAEIFGKTTGKGNFLSIDTSVFNIFTSDDPDIPRELVIDADGRDRFLKYIPRNLNRNGANFDTFVNTIRNYPYPYVINRTCWEFPCLVPSDWSAQHFQRSNNPVTLSDWKAALDITAIKQGVMNLVFHPHGWIRNDQVVELIDHAVKKHGKKVKFLNFREALDRLNKNLLHNGTLRRTDGRDAGTRLIDFNNDGFIDPSVQRPGRTDGEPPYSAVWLWKPKEGKSIRWAETIHRSVSGKDGIIPFGRYGIDSRNRVLNVGGSTFTGDKVRGDYTLGAIFDQKNWQPLKAMRTNERKSITTMHQDVDSGTRFRDIDGNGICELILGYPHEPFVHRFSEFDQAWNRLSFHLPNDLRIVDKSGQDTGLRFVDINDDGHDDIVFSNHERFGIWLFKDSNSGWSIEVTSGKRGEKKPEDEIPPIVRKDGTDNGFFVHSRQLFWQNEDTAGMLDLVDRRSFNDLLKNVEPEAKSPKAALRSMHARPGFRVELVASEPLVMDPVAFDWGSDGELWVVEMADYPLGIDGKGKSGGRVRFLEDTNGDGKYDKSTLFMDGVPYPNGIMPWRNGVLISAAPDVFYAEDTNGDGKADLKRILFTGFREGNQQHRVNGFAWGLDNWVHLANGDSGGVIKAVQTVSGQKVPGKPINFNGRDLRIRPDQGALDLQTGQTQFGRHRDDWGNWFGNNNSNPMFQFVLADHYLRRNPHFAPPSERVGVPEVPGAAPVFPTSRTLPRFNDHSRANRFTSACSTIIYRDDRFGPRFEGNMFVCEPVHNLVNRQVMIREGVRFRSRRAADEQQSEFLTSTDNWFRPVLVRTGPDGALWVADMYRHVIEHPEWIPNDWERRLDLRAGHDKGRIYRVVPVTDKRRMPTLDPTNTASLVAALDSSSGWQRDTAQRLLIHKQDNSVVESLKRMVLTSKRPLARLHALCTLDGLGGLNVKLLKKAIADKHPGVRRHAVRLSEPFLSQSPELMEELWKRVGDADIQVQMQVAYSLGEADDPRTATALARLARQHASNPYLVAAGMSSLNKSNIGPTLAELVRADDKSNSALVAQVLGMAVRFENKDAVAQTLAHVIRSTNDEDSKREKWQIVTTFFEGLNRHRISPNELLESQPELMKVIRSIADPARSTAIDQRAANVDRLAAIQFLGAVRGTDSKSLTELGHLLVPQESFDIQSAIVAALGKQSDERTPATLLTNWKAHSPRLRSQIVETLLSRVSWTKQLITYIKPQAVSLSDIAAVHRQRLLNHTNTAIKASAARLFGHSTNTKRKQVVDAFRKSLQLTANSVAGADVFKKRCSACHKLRDIGKPVGPDLAALKDRSPTALLTAILDPNRAVESKFLSYTAVTENGLSYSGMLVSESGNSVTLSAADGKQKTLLRTDIATLVSSNKSFMPEGLEKDLSHQDIADVIAFVSTEGPRPKSFAGNKPAMIKPDETGKLTLAATNAEIYGPSIIFEPTYKNIGFWRRESDRTVWTIETTKPQSYSVQLNYACDNSTAGNRFLIQIGDHKLTGQINGTGTWDNYQTIELGKINLPGGRHHATFRSDGAIRGYLIDLKEIQLITTKTD